MGANVSSYIAPEWPWVIEPITFALAGLALGKTTFNYMYQTIFWMIMMGVLPMFNYLYLIIDTKTQIGSHGFNWFGKYEASNNIVCNCTGNGIYIPRGRSLFTADDIGGIGISYLVFMLLSWSFFSMRKQVYLQIWYKKGKVCTKQEKWEGKMIQTVGKLWGGGKIIGLYLGSVLVTGVPIFLFQFLSWEKTQPGGVPTGLIVGIIATWIFFALGIGLWALWNKSIDSEGEMMVSTLYQQAQLEGHQYPLMKYIFYEAVYAMQASVYYFIYLIFIILSYWDVSDYSLYVMLFVAIINAIINWVVTIIYYRINIERACADYTEVEEEEVVEIEK